MASSDLLPIAALGAAILLLLWVDLRWFSRGREPTVRQGTIWSIGWFAIGLLVSLVFLALEGGDEALLYTTVYLIERSLSLDNLFVFLLLFAYFAVAAEHRARLLFWGIVFAIALRGVAILGGVALLERYHFVVYVLGGLLLVLAYRVFRDDPESIDPGRNVFVRLARRLFRVSDEPHGERWFVSVDGKRAVTPAFLCLCAIVFTDIAFAIDSIPAAFGITRDAMLIWTANAFALLGMRALFVLVAGLMRRFRYLDEAIAIVLAFVAAKLLLEDVYKFSPLVSLSAVLLILGMGVAVSVVADRRSPSAA